MYPNLKAELARKDLTLEKMVEELKKRDISMTIGTLCQKLKGKYNLTLNEAKTIKEIVGSDISLETLFEEAEK